MTYRELIDWIRDEAQRTAPKLGISVAERQGQLVLEHAEELKRLDPQHGRDYVRLWTPLKADDPGYEQTADRVTTKDVLESLGH